jgi:hypothetical protein
MAELHCLNWALELTGRDINEEMPQSVGFSEGVIVQGGLNPDCSNVSAHAYSKKSDPATYVRAPLIAFKRHKQALFKRVAHDSARHNQDFNYDDERDDLPGGSALDRRTTSWPGFAGHGSAGIFRTLP